MDNAGPKLAKPSFLIIIAFALFRTSHQEPDTNRAEGATWRIAAMGRGRKFRLGNRRKLTVVWSFLLLLALIQWAREFFGLGAGAINAQQIEQYSRAGIRIVLVLGAGLLGCLLLRYLYNAVFFRLDSGTSDSKHPFTDKPWEYDKRVITVIGRVERVLSDDMMFKLRRKMVDVYRTATKNNDHSGRHVHQRFLVSSSILRRGQQIIVYNNTKFGKQPVGKGTWVIIKGEYVHRSSKMRGPFGTVQKSYYGLIHYTHRPLGGIKTFRKRSDLVSYCKVVRASKKQNRKHPPRVRTETALAAQG